MKYGHYLKLGGKYYNVTHPRKNSESTLFNLTKQGQDQYIPQKSIISKFPKKGTLCSPRYFFSYML